ncbi:MAG: hypothetical protein WC340_15995 [Kiritimatiellia bacterium]
MIIKREGKRTIGVHWKHRVLGLDIRWLVAVALCVLCTGMHSFADDESVLFSIGFEEGEATGLWRRWPRSLIQTDTAKLHRDQPYTAQHH